MIKRDILLYESYFKDFYNLQGFEVQQKIDFVLRMLRDLHYISPKHVKHLTNTNGIYELRVSVDNNEYRVLFFFVSGSLIEGGTSIVLCNGFKKKSEKDYKKAIAKAQQIRAEFFV